MTSLEVEIVYMPEYRDFVRGFFWWYLYKYWKFYVFMLLLSGLLLLGPIITGEFIGILGVLFPVGAAVLTLYAVFPSAKQSIDQIKNPTKLVFTLQGLSDGKEQTSVAWSAYQKVLETKSDFILMASNGIIPLPKHFFDNEKQLEIFRDIVQQALGNKAKLKG